MAGRMQPASAPATLFIDMERLTVKDLEKLLKGETKTYRFKTAKALDNARSYVYAYGARYNVKLSTEKNTKTLSLTITKL